MDWHVTDVVIMAVGDGCSISAAWKGFREALALGLTDRLPRMIGVRRPASAVALWDVVTRH